MSRSVGASDFSRGQDERYFEDYVAGSVYEYGSTLVRQEEILEFAKRFDPQPIHIDVEWANSGPFQGVIASGWHTGSMMMRLLADHYLPTTSSLASPGIDELRWFKPVRPGDSLRIRVTVLEARRSRSKPDRGLVRSQIEVINQTGEVVMSLKAMNMVRTRGESLPV